MSFLKSFILVLIFTISLQAQTLDERIASALVFAEQQTLNTLHEIDTTSENRFPRYIEKTESWKWISNPYHKWTSGFFTGSLWNMYKLTSKEEWKNYAQLWTSWLEDTQDIASIWTDHGFIIKPSYVNGFYITDDITYLPIIIKSAENYIAGRWHEDAKVMHGYDRSVWLNTPGVISGTVDQLMNLDLLFEASLLSGDTTFSAIASAYAETVMENHVRDDYSTFHVVRFNEATGDAVNKGTIQGVSDSSTWARGHAWSTYGFTMCYRYTHDERFLNTAIGLAHFFIDHLPTDDGVTYWDFDVPQNSSEPKDASATVIVASALLELISFTEDEAEITKFRNAAYAMLESLASDKYLADPNITNAILLHSTAHKPANKRIDIPLIYADYYFIEAMLRYQADRLTNIDDNKNSYPTAPQIFVLEQNYPNPFNPSTIIAYGLPKADHVKITVYDIMGKEVRTLVNERQNGGRYKIKWNGKDNSGLNVSSGMYIYKIDAGTFQMAKKMILVK